MRKTSQTFYKVGIIVALIASAIYVTLGTIWIILGIVGLCNKDFIVDLIKAWSPETTEITDKVIVAYCWSRLIGRGIWMLVGQAALCVVSAIFTNKAYKEETKPWAITAIVFSVLSGTLFAIPGGILNIIYVSREEEKKDPNVVDAEVEEKKE